LYGDWFPFANGFRLSAGIYLRNMEAKAEGRPTAAGTVRVNNTVVGYRTDDTLSGQVKFPTVAPYLGLGWGHHGAHTPELRGFCLRVDCGSK